jgi:hypothetical protein
MFVLWSSLPFEKDEGTGAEGSQRIPAALMRFGGGL